MGRGGDKSALQVRDAQKGPSEWCHRAARLTQPWEPQTSSQRGENCSCRTWKSGLKAERGDLPFMVIQRSTALSFPFNTPHLSNTRLEHLKFWGFYLIFQCVVYLPSYQHSLLSSVQRLRSECWWKLFWERVKAKHCSPATPHSKSLKADCSSQPLLVCSLSFSSSCLCLLDPGNSETCTKSKIQSAQIGLSNISFQQSLT